MMARGGLNRRSSWRHRSTTAAAESDAAAEKKVRTATGDAAYNADWDGIGSSDDLALATLRLLHSARQMVDTSRWWTLSWPNSAISPLGTACGLSTEGTFKLLRVLRKVMIQHVRELWVVVMDRRHAADNEAKRAALKDEWLKLSRILENMRNRRGKLIPGWVTVRLKAPSTVRPLARDPQVLIGWPFPLGFGLDGRLLLCYWHGVGGFMFNSSSSSRFGWVAPRSGEPLFPN